MCIGCQGTGKEFEIYDHRRLERPCPDCGGEGVRGGSAIQLAERSGGGGGGGSSAGRLPAYEQELQLRAELLLQLERQVLRMR
jgi:hypothetical protein